jgi:hypothetical protein
VEVEIPSPGVGDPDPQREAGAGPWKGGVHNTAPGQAVAETLQIWAFSYFVLGPGVPTGIDEAVP